MEEGDAESLDVWSGDKEGPRRRGLEGTSLAPVITVAGCVTDEGATEDTTLPRLGTSPSSPAVVTSTPGPPRRPAVAGRMSQTKLCT